MLKEELREEILREMCGADGVKASLIRHTLVLSEAVMVVPFPDNFKMLNIAPYDKKGDLVMHVEVFYAWMDFKRVSELARCRVFPLTLLGLA